MEHMEQSTRASRQVGSGFKRIEGKMITTVLSSVISCFVVDITLHSYTLYLRSTYKSTCTSAADVEDNPSTSVIHLFEEGQCWQGRLMS